MRRISTKKKKRVALVLLPMQGVVSGCYLSIGVLSLASSIEMHDYQPIIVDLNMFSLIQRNFSDYFKQMAQEILRHNPDVIGFSVTCDNLPVSLLIARECKQLFPEIPIVFGGPEVSFEEVEVMRAFKQVDVVVRGEGEITLVELLQALEKNTSLSGVLGITFRENERVIRNPDRHLMEDLDELPFLNYSLVPNIDKYYLGLEAGRGCSFCCTFCSTCRVWRRKPRMKSPQRLGEELKRASHLFKKRFIFVDDHFLVSREFVDEFLCLTANKGFVWACNSRLDALDESLIKKLKQAGCRGITLGIETGSLETQKQIKKHLPLSRLPGVVQMLSQYGIDVNLSFVIGFPEETESQIDDTLRMTLKLKKINPDISIHTNLVATFKGSELYEKVKGKCDKYSFMAMGMCPLVTGLPEEVSLIKKYPHIFPSFYYFGNDMIEPRILQRISFLFLFLLSSYAGPTLSLLEHLSATPFQLGKKMISFFDAEGVEWDPIHGTHFPQYVFPFRRFIREYAKPLYKDFFWWDKAFTRWEEKRAGTKN
jgi:radical SAM superfamily enzyme YgiQ (UPF0313 family)